MAEARICDECDSVIGSGPGQKKPINSLRLPLKIGEVLVPWEPQKLSTTSGPPFKDEQKDICSVCGIAAIKAWLRDIGAL